jgi:multicomponent Na+:H+ antiporter subunit B
VVTFVPVLRGKPILTHEPPPSASVTHVGSVELLTAVAFDIAVFLLVFGFVVTTIGLVSRVRQGDEP